MREADRQALLRLVNAMMDDLRHNPVIERGKLRASLEQRTRKMQDILYRKRREPWGS